MYKQVLTALLAVLANTCDVAAQDTFLGLGSPNPGIFRLTPGGVLTQINFPAGTVLPGGNAAFEIDERNGHLIVANRTTAGGDIQIFRTIVAGPTVVSQTLLCTIPNSPGPASLRADMHRAPDGSYVIMSRDNGVLRLDRIGITMQGGIATPIPITNPAIFNQQRMTEIAVDDTGAIFLTGPWLSGPQLSSIFRLDPAGGNATVFTSSTIIDYSSVEVLANGSLIAGGLPFQAGNAFNLACGITAGNQGALAFVGSAPPGVIDAVVELHVDASGQALMGLNSTTPSLQSHNVAPCGFGAVLQLLNASVAKVTRDEPLRRAEYGSACPVSQAMLGRNTELTAPITGFPWVLGLTNGIPNGGAIISLGNSELATPVDLSGLGANGCSLFQSNEASSSLINLDPQGQAQFVLMVPNDPSLINAPLFGQWAVLTNFNSFGLATTNAVHSIIQ